MAHIIDSYDISHQDNALNFFGSVSAVGQSMTGNGSKVGSIIFYLKKSGSPTGNMVSKIYAHAGTFGSSSVPTGAALAVSNSYDISTLTTSLQLITFTFSGANQITLTNAIHYIVDVEYPASNTDFLVMGCDFDPTSAPGNMCLLNPAWLPDIQRDACFYVYDNSSQPSGPLPLFHPAP